MITGEIIDTEWEEIPPAPQKQEVKLKGSKVCLAINLILLGAICKMACTAFYWASLLR